jgi:hypothetical protein
MLDFEKRTPLDEKPSTWWPVQMPSGQLKASIICPNKHYGFLANHQIADDGTVTPSVVCPGGGQGTCNFHDHTKLGGWERDASR